MTFPGENVVRADINVLGLKEVLDEAWSTTDPALLMAADMLTCVLLRSGLTTLFRASNRLVRLAFWLNTPLMLTVVPAMLQV